MSKSISEKYWTSVYPSCRRHSEEDRNYAVFHLLAARRARIALDHAHWDWKQVKSNHIHCILTNLPTSREPDDYVDQYKVRQAFKVLSERGALSRKEMAQLEFLYLNLLQHYEEGVPNLEAEIEGNPELFCEAISLAYVREDSIKDEQSTKDEQDRDLAQKAHMLLNIISRIPGHDQRGILCTENLKEWVLKAQELCRANGRQKVGDNYIGELLSHAPVGEDGVWPCKPVREILDGVFNDDISTGFRIGRRNSRGPYRCGKGGTQERKLTAQYEEWAKRCDYSYPKMAEVLRELAKSYEVEADWQDQDAAVQRRLGY